MTKKETSPGVGRNLEKIGGGEREKLINRLKDLETRRQEHKKRLRELMAAGDRSAIEKLRISKETGDLRSDIEKLFKSEYDLARFISSASGGYSELRETKNVLLEAGIDLSNNP